jgi:5-methylcytosine-specific restriction protein A
MKLSNMRPGLGGLPSRFSHLPDERTRSRMRDAAVPWRGWYKTARWRALRLAVFVRDGFKCQWRGCGRVQGDVSQLVADHVVRHRGDERLFWDMNNLQTLCKTCHDSKKQAQERRQGA